MKISAQEEYGLRCLVQLASLPELCRYRLSGKLATCQEVCGLNERPEVKESVRRRTIVEQIHNDGDQTERRDARKVQDPQTDASPVDIEK